MNFPKGKDFAFTILDDTDDSTLENIRPVYELLTQLGMRTTKTVWPCACPEGSERFFAADTLDRADYLDYVKKLYYDGFEIASHGATMSSSTRDRTAAGLEFLKAHFNGAVRVYCNHGQNLENIYWGADRYTTRFARLVILALQRVAGSEKYQGHIGGSDYFWGDLCLENFDYVRNFAFERLDVYRVASMQPYRLPSTPYVNHWFSTADAPDIEAFLRLVSRENIGRLVNDRGYTIVSTHLGKGFARHGDPDPRFVEIMSEIAKMNGWFVPVSELLDYLRTQNGTRAASSWELLRLELTHILDRVHARLQGR